MTDASARGRLGDVVACTGGPFTRTQARAAGFSGAKIRRLLRSGAWVTLRRGVYVEASVLAAADDDRRRRHALEVAAVLVSLGRDVVAGGLSAARIFGMATFTPAAELVVITSGSLSRGERREGYVVRRAELPERHCARRHGVPLTSPARTVVDVARWESLNGGVVIADSALHQGLLSLSELRQVLVDCGGWSGIDRARRVIELADPRAESPLESVSRVSMYEQGIPEPRTQVVVADVSGSFARADFLWDEFGVIGEADGLVKYEPDGRRTTREIVWAEKRREERLADAGFEVVRWGWADARNPPRLAHRLRAAFARGTERKRGRAGRG